MVVLLYLLSKKEHQIKVIPQDTIVENIARYNNLEIISLDEVKKEEFNLLITCHGRKKLSDEILHKGPCINLHPCLFKYKGADPIGRYMLNKDTYASVGCHFMTEKIDDGEFLCEIFFDTPVITSYDEFYNLSYPFYVECIHAALILFSWEYQI